MAKTKSALTLQASALDNLSTVLIALVSQAKVTQADRDQAKADLALLIQEDAENAEAVELATENIGKLVELVSDAILPEAPEVPVEEVPAPIVDEAPVEVEVAPAE